MCPRRPMDLQLSVAVPSRTIETAPPSELVTYRENVKGRLSGNDVPGLRTPPPRIILPNDQLFILESANHITRSAHHLPSPLSSLLSADTWPELRDLLSHRDSSRATTSSGRAQEISHAKAQMDVEIVLESVQDLESSDGYVACSVCDFFCNPMRNSLIDGILLVRSNARTRLTIQHGATSFENATC